ncbi:hypothetical protein MPSEU_000507100 [Mayamaea pseudoterrestris]|nr:hypothetical protein MPSEU_000507100 [Mayamaea pseudoterrestris]
MGMVEQVEVYAIFVSRTGSEYSSVQDSCLIEADSSAPRLPTCSEATMRFDLFAFGLFQLTFCGTSTQSLQIGSIMGQAISSTQFYFYGRKHFTQTGYLKHVSSYYSQPPQSLASIPLGASNADGIDMTGKVVLVTGANSGLGKQVATYAAAKGAKLYMLCRNEQKAEQAKQDILQEIKTSGGDDAATTNGSFTPTVEVIVVDVSEMESVRSAAKELQARESKVDVIVCNAGVLLNDRTETSEGHEATFASHLLGGAYLLPQLLLPQLEAADGARVITVTSGGMYNFKLPSWEVLTSDKSVTYNGVNAYAYAKRGQVLLAERRSHEQPKVKWVTVHPGWADTNAVDEAFGDKKKYLQPLREPWQGAEGVAWLMAADASELENGAFYLDRKPQPKHIAGPFFTEGHYTKNKPEEVDAFMIKLKEAAGL